MTGWKVKTLGEVCTLQRGFDLPTSDRQAGPFPIISSSGSIDFHSEPKVLGPGVITGRSGSIGAVFFEENDFWPLNTTLYVKDFKGNDPRFVYFLLQSIDIKSFAGGTGVPTLNRNNVHEAPVYSVNSLSEQRRIVAILDEAFAGLAVMRANAEANLRNARALFESHLNAIFSQRGEGWVDYPISKVATKIGSGATPRGGQESYKAAGIPLIRSMNVHDRRFKFDDLAFLDDEQAQKLDNVTVQKDDVLLNITGASVARCCRVPEELASARVNQHVSIIRPIQSLVLARFLEIALTAKANKDRLLGVGEKGGSTRQAITKVEIEEFKLSCPQIKHQRMIIGLADELEVESTRLESLYRQKLAAIDELKQSILHRAFSGQLTATDELAA